jgi:hypothetical protein
MRAFLKALDTGNIALAPEWAAALRWTRCRMAHGADADLHSLGTGTGGANATGARRAGT